MRIYLLPVSQTQCVVWCQHSNLPLASKRVKYEEQITQKCSDFWHRFEKSDSKIKQFISKNVNKLLAKISYKEYCLRTVPPLHKFKRTANNGDFMVSLQNAQQQNIPIRKTEFVFPHSVQLTHDFASARSYLTRTYKEAQKQHFKQLCMCVLGLPLTFPLAVNPFIPNFPAFYLTYRAWCNFKALQACKHLKYLVTNHQLMEVKCEKLEQIYKEGVEIDGVGAVKRVVGECNGG